MSNKISLGQDSLEAHTEHKRRMAARRAFAEEDYVAPRSLFHVNDNEFMNEAPEHTRQHKQFDVYD